MQSLHVVSDEESHTKGSSCKYLHKLMLFLVGLVVPLCITSSIKVNNCLLSVYEQTKYFLSAIKYSPKN